MRSMNVATRTRSKGFCVAGTSMKRMASWYRCHKVLPRRQIAYNTSFPKELR